MGSDLGVGVIGVGNAPSGWARTGHLPAIAAAPGLRVTAVSARSQESAEAGAEAAAAYSARPRAFADAAALIADPSVEVVSIVSPVPTHADLVRAAVDAGKPVFTEWPATPTAAATATLRDEVEDRGGRVAVGLQARAGAAAVELRRLLDEGAIGRVLSINVLSTAAAFGSHVPSAALSLERPDVGMNLMTIQLAHTLDLAALLGGGVERFAAQTTIQFPTLTVEDSHDTFGRTLPDHVAVQGRLRSGASLIVEVAGGRPVDATPFHLEVVGDAGRLSLHGGGPRGFQAGVLRLRRDGEAVTLRDHLDGHPDDAAVNLASAYLALRADIDDGGSRSADLSDAATLAGLIDDVREAAGIPGRIEAP